MGKQLEKAFALHRAGQLEEAESLYAGICRRDRDDAAAAFLLGVARLELGRQDEAVQPLRRAALLRPTHFETQRALAEACDRLGLGDEALAAHLRVVTLRPDDAQARLNLGIARLAVFDGKAALGDFEAAARLRPDLVNAQTNAGLALKMLGQADAARSRFEAALAIAPDDVPALFNLGNLLGQGGQAAAAEPWLRKALALAPGLVEAKLALAHVMRETARTDVALVLVDEVLAASPDHPIAIVWRAMLRLPVVYRDADEVAAARAAYAEALDELRDRVAQAPVRFLPGIASTRPFFLAYQGDDDRALQSAYGGIVAAVVGERGAKLTPRRPPSRSRLRVGIVSGYFRHHSVWKIPTRGWLTHLDRSAFEVICYHTGAATDAETDAARCLSDRFVQGPSSFEGWAGTIVGDACDVLLYPEIGMDPMCVLLAALRLAPVQGNGLGHPVTSGLPTMDYALSSALMEPPGADAHYTERLVRLPNLGIAYDYLDLPPATTTRAAMGVPDECFAFWCGQSLFKYQPRHDDVFARIAEAAPHCRFVFIGFQSGDAVTQVFAARLDRVFAARGMDARRFCIFLPRQSASAFVAAAGQCDAILDSIGWSGFNSTMESLVHDLPIVTCDGPFMRGRHSAAILRMMGMPERVAATTDALIEMAVRLASEPAICRVFSEQIAVAKLRLLNDASPMRALGEVLQTTIAEHAGAVARRPAQGVAR